uniref:Uncharacterized protein n=1 Tax=Pseudomonas phage HRDY3 TaxID=3236930 RepID=A0AB39CET6_9VIRU
MKEAKQYHIYLTGAIHIGSVTPQLMTTCISQFERDGYPWMASLLRDLIIDAKLRADPEYPQDRRVVVNEVQAMLWGKAIGATKATRRAFDCTGFKQRHGLFLSYGVHPMPNDDAVRCPCCKRPY